MYMEYMYVLMYVCIGTTTVTVTAQNKTRDIHTFVAKYKKIPLIV